MPITSIPLPDLDIPKHVHDQTILISGTEITAHHDERMIVRCNSEGLAVLLCMALDQYGITCHRKLSKEKPICYVIVALNA